jgi:hypothetical protein
VVGCVELLLMEEAIEAAWQARGMEVEAARLRAGRFSCAMNRLIQRAQDKLSSRSERGDFQVFMCAASQHPGGYEAERHRRYGCEAQS